MVGLERMSDYRRFTEHMKPMHTNAVPCSLWAPGPLGEEE